MRRLFSFAVPFFALGLIACSPQVYEMSMEMRYPSSSGLDLTGKSVAMIYPYGLTQEEMQLTSSVAGALADQLDAAYPESDSTSLYTIQYTDDFAKMATPDSLVNLVLKTDADVVFLFGHPSEFSDGYRQGGFRLPLYCYDSMGGEKSGVKTFTITADAGSDAAASGKNIGNRISSSFVPTWREEEFGIWYTDNSAWNNALLQALDFKWDAAVKTWMSILETTDDINIRALLEYNIGLGCFMMGNRDLALQWLQQSSSEKNSDMTTALINRIKRRD